MNILQRSAPIVVLLLSLCAIPTLPCSCMANNAVCSSYWDTPLLFRGRVTQIKFVPELQEQMIGGKPVTFEGPGRLEVHFTVLEKLRGEPGSEVVIRTSAQSSACGVAFEDGGEYLVFSYDANGEWWTNACSHTHQITDPAQDADLQWIHALASAPHGGTIFGTVTHASPDLDNNSYKIDPLGGVSIRIQGPDTRTVKTDADGNFSVSGLAIGKYEVLPQYSGGLGPATPQSVSVRDKGCAQVHFSAQSDGIVDGHLLNADLTPASGVVIQLNRVQEGNEPAWTQGFHIDTTDNTGHFHFEPVQPGAYVLGVNLDLPSAGASFQHRNFYPGKSQAEQAEILHVVGAQHIDGLRYVLPAEPSRKNLPITVKLVLGDGSAPANWSLELWNPEWPNYYWGPNAKQDGTGSYTIELPEGELYNLFANVEDPENHYPCAGPVAVVASPNQTAVTLKVCGANGSCRDQHITEPAVH
jgi:hypothetical protein